MAGPGGGGEDGSGQEKLPLPSVEEAGGNQGLPRRLLYLKSAMRHIREEPVSPEELARGASRKSGSPLSPFLLPDGGWHRDTIERGRLTPEEGVDIKIPHVRKHQEAIQGGALASPSGTLGTAQEGREGGAVTETRFTNRMAGRGYSRQVAMRREDRTERELARAGGLLMGEDTQALNAAIRREAVLDFLMNRDGSYFHHHKRMTRAEFEADKKLSQAFKLLATSFVGQEDSADREEIVAIVEARR